MASGSSSLHLNSTEPSSSSSSITEGRSASRRRTIQPPSRFRQSPDKSSVPLPSSFSLPSSSSNLIQHRPAHTPTAQPRQRSKPVPAPPLPPTIKIKSSAIASREEEVSHHSLKLAATEDVEVGWPNRHNKGRVVEEDLKDRILMAVCGALASIENKALCLQEVADICAAKGWIKPSPSLSVSNLVSAAIRSHYRRTTAANRPPLLSKHVLLGSASEINIAPALHPDSINADRRPKGTVWFLSSDAGYWNPFERARVAHHLMKDGEGTKNSGVTSKRKREEAAGSSSSAVAPATFGGGLKIRLKVLGGLREEESTQHDVSMAGAGEDRGEGSSSHSRSLGSSSSGADPRLGRGRRQRGPKDGFPDFARPVSDDEDDLSDDQTPTSSLPNHPDSHLHQRAHFVPPKRLQARHSLPATSSSRSLPASFHGNHRHSHRPAAAEDSDSSSSSEGEDFHEAMLRSDDFAFGMDEDGSADGSGDTPATTPRDGGLDGLSDQQSAAGGGGGKSAASASPPPRRSPFPPAPTPAEVLAGGPVPISADPNHIPAREPVNSLSSSELSDSNLLRHRLATAPHSPVRPFNSDLLHPQSAPPAGSLALPRMQALSPSPSPSPAMPSVLLPHLQSLPSFISHSSPSRLSFHQHLTSGIGSAPNSPSTETKEQEEAFNLTLSLLPADFKPVIRDHRFGESSGDEFDDSESICVIQAEDASPPSDASGLFDDFGDVGGRENSLARSEDDPHRKAERWAMESSSSAGGIKLEPSSPRMLLMDEETASPREDGFSRDSSREGDDEGEDEEDDEETASGLLAAFRGGDDEMMDDEDEVDGNEDFLGPESVGLEELERVWGGGRRGERCSPFSGSAGGGDFGGVKMEDVDGDSRMETIEEMKKEKEAFAQALVKKVRAATASMLSPEQVDDEEMDDPLNEPSTSTRPSNSLRPTTSSSSVSKRRVASSSNSNSTPRPTTLPSKQKRRESLLPKPLPAPVRCAYGHKRTNTASMIEMVGLLDVEDFDEMDLLFTPESGIGGRRAGSAARRSESVDASGMSSDVEYLGEGGSSSMSGIPPLVDVETSSNLGGGANGGPSNVAAPKPPVGRPLPRRSIFAPRPLDLPAVPAIPQLVQPLKQLSPNVNATCISGIPVFMCFFSNVVLLRRIDSEYVNMSTGLEALAIVGPGEEAKKKEILSPIQDHVVVEWGTSVGSGVNGIWVPLQVARGLALRFTAGSPLLSTFFDLRLANSFPPQLVEAALSQTLRSPSGFAIPPPRLPASRPISKASSSLTTSKPTSSGSSSSSSTKLSGIPRPNAPKPSSLSTSSVPSPVAKSKPSSSKPKLKATPTASTSTVANTPISTGSASPRPVVEGPPKLPRTTIATAAKKAKKEAAVAAAASSSSTSATTSTKVKTKKAKKDRTPSTTAGLLYESSSSLSEVDEDAGPRSISPEKESVVSTDAPISRSTRRTSRVGGSK